MDTILFHTETSTISLPAPEPGALTLTSRKQGKAITASGHSIVADSGISIKAISLSFPGLTNEERDALENFFSNSACGMQNSFTYTDSSGVNHTARFSEPSITWQSPASTVHDATLKLEINI